MNIEMISLRECPQMLEAFISYFQAHWANEASLMVYENCLRSSVDAEGPLPQWYVLTENGRIIACAGMIPNDFISRMDLMPWLCALYVEPDCRGRALGSRLIERCRKDAAEMGFPTLYLCTDHKGYYEKYGFEYLADGYHPWGECSRIYRVKTE